jgi:lantibiotic modifying enzyme
VGRGAQIEVTHCTCSSDLYSGTAGIALFLSALARQTLDPIHRHTAMAAMSQSLARAERHRSQSSPAFFTGATGEAWASLQVGENLNAVGFIEHGLAAMEKIAASEMPAWNGTDVIHGRAGAIVAALAVARKYRKEALLDWACRQGAAILSMAHRQEIGWSWPETVGARGMNGFSHGAAGIAWALGELAWVSGREEFGRAARDAVRYEQHWFDSQQGNWPDFFTEYMAHPNRPPSYSISWCHGAPGISLSRVRLWQRFSGEYRQQAEAALETTSRKLAEILSQDVEDNFCLCHGLCGTAEALLIGAGAFDSPALAEIAHRVAQLGIGRYAEPGLPWPCGLNYKGAASPGLMLGRAGTGYFYLRLQSPAQVPSVLLLDC